MSFKVHLSGSYRGVSGSNYSLHLDPEDRDITDYAAVGSAVPMKVWHKRVLSINMDMNVVQSELRKELEDESTQSIIASVFALYKGVEWDGNNNVGLWATGPHGEPSDELEGLLHQLGQVLAEVPRHTEAADWLIDLDWALFHDYAVNHNLAEMASAITADAREDGIYLETEAVVDVLKNWLEEAVSDLSDEDDLTDAELSDVSLGRRLLTAAA